MSIELLAPAGNLEKLKIAFQYGADAVYLAGHQFSLRSAASNFNTEEIKSAIQFAQKNNKRVYVTVNAFLHEWELERLPEFLKTLEQLQPNALICSDMGVISLALKHTSIPVHVSTQASVINSYHAKIWKDLGAKRIVLGREVSIKEASRIKEKVDIEIEMFVHGAMCMSYSGHCAMSTYVAHRDSNRGGCIQNCRFKYTLFNNDEPEAHSHLLSSKDLCGIESIGEFVSTGIDSVKIEGRMKSNLYIASTVRAYSNALKDWNLNKTVDFEYWKKELQKIPYRDYTSGSLVSDADSDSVYLQGKEMGKDYKMAGTIIEIDKAKNRFAFQAKNRLFPGDTIEILTFSGDLVTIQLKELKNLKETPLEVVQPNNVIWAPLEKGIEINNVARINRP